MFIGHGRKKRDDQGGSETTDSGHQGGLACSNSAGAQCADEERFVAAEYPKDRV
jgi:hypothetical protein